MKTTPRNWEIVEKRFWKAIPCLAVSLIFLIAESKLIRYQHIIKDGYEPHIYRFLTHFFQIRIWKTILLSII
jgi:hypothetical protein